MSSQMHNFSIFTAALDGNTNYCVTGPDCQILSIMVKPGERVVSEPGSMMFMSSDVKTSMECGNFSRTFTGESCCKSIFTNTGSKNGFIALTPNFPAKVLPISLPNYGKKIITKKGAFLSSIGDVSVTANFDCCSCASCCGGLGMIRQEMTGTGTAFIAAGGTVLTKVLEPNEVLVVDSESVVGFADTVKFGVRTAGGCCTCCFGGEGLFNSTMTGPGLVIVQSMAFEKYRRAVAPPQRQDGNSKGEAPPS